MEKISLNNTWVCERLDNTGLKVNVSVPHDAMLSEKRTVNSNGGANICWFEGYDYSYTKAVFIPEALAGKTLILEFEGVYRNSAVFVNGQKAGGTPYGYTNFYVELDDYVRYGEENVIKVIANNSKQPNSRWYTGTGIYRPVWLYVFPEKHVVLNGIKIKTITHEPPVIEVKIITTHGGSVDIQILDGNKTLTQKTVVTNGDRSAVASFDLLEAELWEPGNPKLYNCRVTYGEDVQEVNFGIRTVECGSKNGLRINGKRTILRGACVHHDNGLLGAAAHPFAEERKVRLLMEAGYNAIRSSHNPCSKDMLDACDRLGMLVLDEYADMWYIHKNRYDYADWFAEWWQRDLHAMVEKDYNHPSVIMYSIGNEVAETGQPRGITLCKDMRDYLHKIDDRPVTCGINIFFNFLSSIGLGVYSDKKADKEAERLAKSGTASKKGSVGSEFFNNVAGLLGAKFMKFGATLHGSDVKTRDAFANLDVAGYNYGINRYKKDLRKYPNRIILGTETFCADAYSFWETAKANPALIGDFVWSGIDYLGELGIGAWEYKDYVPDFNRGPGWMTAGQGRLDITGRQCAEVAYTQVAFELSSIRIGVVPADRAFKPHSPSAWRMTNALESWAWNGCEDMKTKVEVYARGDHIKLFLNNTLIATGRPKNNCKTVFRVEWQPGELTAAAYDAGGRELYRTSLYSAQEQTTLSILPEQEVINENSLCYVRLKFTDINGTVKPLERDVIKINVSGGTLLAAGNGCSYSEHGYLVSDTDTYYGEALAVVKPDGCGEIIINAKCKYGDFSAKVQCIADEIKTGVLQYV
jgi:beta-galactosidase